MHINTAAISMLKISQSLSETVLLDVLFALVVLATCLRHAEAYNRQAEVASDVMFSPLQRRAIAGRLSPFLGRQGNVFAPMNQAPCWERLFANEAVEGPPAAKDPESARGFETQGPSTEQGRKIKEMEENFEGWR